MTSNIHMLPPRDEQIGCLGEAALPGRAVDQSGSDPKLPSPRWGRMVCTVSCGMLVAVSALGQDMLMPPNSAPTVEEELLVPLEPTNSPALVLWDASTRIETGLGYRDNILLTTVAPESSAFAKIAGDVSVIRLSESGSEFTAFLLGEDMQYLNTTSVGGERFASAIANLGQPIGTRETLEAEFSYLYQYQVMDVSEMETDLRRVLVEGHRLTFEPGWKHAFSPNWTVQVVGTATRQFFQGELDDYWEPGAKAGLIRTFGYGSELSGWFSSAHWLYDTREQTTTDGVSIPGTSLAYWRPEVSMQWRQYWDKDKNWRTTTRIAWLRNQDNGSGYYDYDRFTLTGQLRWRHEDWTVSGGARCGWYNYREQQIQGDNRYRTYVTLNLRIERRVSRRWFLFADADREWNLSNDPFDEYGDWMASTGFGFEY